MKLQSHFLLLGLFCLASADAAPPATPLEFKDLAGRQQTPLVARDRKASVLFFVLPDCPISNAYAPEMKRIAEEYAKKDVATFVVYVDPDLTEEAARKHAMDYGYACPVIRDSTLQLVQATGVTIAPEVCVVGPDCARLYRGRIDNLYAGLGKRRPKATQHDLRDALDAVLSGKPVPQETTSAIGCYIAKPADKPNAKADKPSVK